MLHRLLADALVVVHLAFVVFVVAGSLLVAWRPRVAWLHVPAFAWGAWISFTGGVCPLTPLENRLRRLGGEAGYEGSFVENYLLPILYPQNLTHDLQIVLGGIVLVVNALGYGFVLFRWGRRKKARGR